MEWIEVTAKTIAEAKELALDRLGVVDDELEFEVLDEPRSGLFRRSDARIRARVKPISREKPTDRRRRRRGPEKSGRPNGRGGSGARTSSHAASGDDAASTRAPARTPSSREGKGEDAEDARPAGQGSRSRRRGGRGRGGSGGARKAGTAEKKTTVPAGADGDEKAEAVMDVETVPVAEQAAHAVEFTSGLVGKMGFAASVRSDIDDDTITVRVDGDNLGVLVGPRGATLHALEEVVRAAVQHFAGGHSARVHVDVAGYRERRREALAAFARQVADDVKASGSSRALEPMNSADRKVVHDVLAEIDGVTTASEGEDPRRRVVIHAE